MANCLIMLALPKNSGKILAAGAHADNLGLQCGGWTIEWQGGIENNYTTRTTILKGIEAIIDKSTQVIYKEQPDAEFVKSGGFLTAIVVVGEIPYAETKGGNLNLTLPAPGPDLIKNVCGSVKCVVVLISGRPLVMEPHMQSMDALVAAWLPGSEGQGITDVLFGGTGLGLRRSPVPPRKTAQRKGGGQFRLFTWSVGPTKKLGGKLDANSAMWAPLNPT